ncbi:MAG: GAF domain-containing protein [Desulfatiglandaceae bacterium]
MKIEDIDPFNIIDFTEWQRMVNLLCKIAGVKSAAITKLEEPNIEVFKVSKNIDNPLHEGLQVELASHYCEEVINKRDRVIVRDARESKRWANAPEIRHSLISYMGYPLLLPNGNIFGTICIHDSKANAYSEDIDELIKSFRKIVESHFLLATQATELKNKINEIQLLKGIIPICSYCKNLRNDEGYWVKIEEFLRTHPDTDFSHSLCPECAKKYYPELDLYHK